MSARTASSGVALACALGALIAAPPAQAAKVTFGASLAAITDINSDPAKTCAAGDFWNNAIINTVPFNVRGSCQFAASGIFQGQVFGSVIPGSGTVTAARIKIGSITGPMRINLVRTLFQQTGNVASPTGAPPYLVQYGPTFTPTANAVTEVALNFKVNTQATPDPSDTTTVAGADWLAVEVLDANTPVPLTPYPGAVFFAAFPGPTAANVPAPSPGPLPNFGQIGYVLPLNADLETGTGSTGGGGGGGAAPTTPRGATATLGAKTARVAAGRALVNLQCQGADCAGLVTLRPAGAGANARSAATTSYGAARFSGKAGQRVLVRVKLNSKGKQLLSRKRSVTVRAVVKLDGAASATTLKLTLRR